MCFRCDMITGEKQAERGIIRRRTSAEVAERERIAKKRRELISALEATPVTLQPGRQQRLFLLLFDHRRPGQLTESELDEIRQKHL